jgi:hypothetical protein
MSLSPAQEQLARAKRYLKRMERMGTTDEDTDDMYSFFIFAWHLADWTANDPTLNPRPTLKQLQEATPSIKLCGDIADGMKHFILTRPKPRPYGEVTFKDIRITPGEGTQARYRFTFPDGTTKDAVDFAREIVKGWEGILRQYRVAV